MNLQLITTISEFSNLKDGWSKLLNNCEDNQVFFTWEWINTYIVKLLSDEEKLFIILLKDRGRYIAIAPLKIKNTIVFYSKEKLLTNLTDMTTDYNSIIIDKSYNYKKIIEKIVDTLKENSDKWDIMRLQNINEKSYLIQNLYEVLMKKELSSVSIYTNTVCPYLKYTDLDVKSNKKQINDISRRKRKIENDSNIDMYINEEFNEEVFNKLIEFKNDKYSQGVLNNSKIVDFYKEISKKMPENIHFSYMRADDKIVAVHFGFKDKNKIYYYMPSFDPEYGNKGVGMILLKEIIDSEQGNVKIFDFLRGNEPYKFIWTDRMTYNYDIWAVSSMNSNFLAKLYVNLFVLFKTVPFFRNLHKKIKKTDK